MLDKILHLFGGRINLIKVAIANVPILHVIVQDACKDHQYIEEVSKGVLIGRGKGKKGSHCEMVGGVQSVGCQLGRAGSKLDLTDLKIGRVGQFWAGLGSSTNVKPELIFGLGLSPSYFSPTLDLARPEVN